MYLKNKNCDIHIRVSSEEYAMYKHCAGKYDRSVSDYIRATMLSICSAILAEEEVRDEYC